MSDERSLKELRDLARKRHRAATKKISRLRNQQGVELTGSKVDPRRDIKKIGRYTRKQLESYIKQLDSFQSRKTQFVPDSRRRPVDAAKWREYKKLEARYNQHVSEQLTKFDHIRYGPLKTSERVRLMTPNRPQDTNQVVNILQPVNRRPVSMRNEGALARLERDMKHKMTPEYRAKELKNNRARMLEAATRFGDEELVNTVEQLSDNQFEYVWFYSPEEVSNFYLWYEETGRSESDRLGSIGEDSRGRFVEFINETVAKIK